MPKPLTLLLVAGSRPNFMKIAPVIHPIRANHAALQANRRIGCEVYCGGDTMTSQLKALSVR